jgi:hypothetical protein
LLKQSRKPQKNKADRAHILFVLAAIRDRHVLLECLNIYPRRRLSRIRKAEKGEVVEWRQPNTEDYSVIIEAPAEGLATKWL